MYAPIFSSKSGDTFLSNRDLKFCWSPYYQLTIISSTKNDVIRCIWFYVQIAQLLFAVRDLVYRIIWIEKIINTFQDPPLFAQSCAKVHEWLQIKWFEFFFEKISIIHFKSQAFASILRNNKSKKEKAKWDSRMHSASLDNI